MCMTQNRLITKHIDDVLDTKHIDDVLETKHICDDIMNHCSTE